MNALAIVRAAPQAPCRPLPRHVLDAPGWAAMATALADEPDVELLGLWADTLQVHALLRDRAADEPLLASVAVEGGAYAALSPARPAAAWMERAVEDLWGHVARPAPGAAAEGGGGGWLDHGHWPLAAPLGRVRGARAAPARPAPESTPEPTSTGQTTLVLGPVRGGMAPPAALRLGVVAEAVRAAEARLGYAHAGVLALMRGKTPRDAVRFVARLSAEATVAHATAFARATEAATGTDAPARAHALRGVMAELERIAAHLGWLRDVAEAAAARRVAATVARHEAALRDATARAFGQRLLLDAVIPGGVAVDLADAGAAALLDVAGALEPELAPLLAPGRFLPGVADRLVGIAPVPAGEAARWATGGPTGRASGRLVDLRRRPGYAPYDAAALPSDKVSAGVRTGGDAAARWAIRVFEIGDGIRLLRALLGALPGGPVALPLPMASGEGLGWAEAPEGDAWHWLRLDGGLIGAAMATDPGWRRWPLLGSAVRGPAALGTMAVALASLGGPTGGTDL